MASAFSCSNSHSTDGVAAANTGALPKLHNSGSLVHYFALFEEMKYRTSGYKPESSEASVLVGASNVFGTVVASSLMDRQGRKNLLITSFSAMSQMPAFPLSLDFML
ncbi:Major facilitator, sugar transporter-like [Sesbania bispinosa]|nr:Major facilitator, sugar transporter-like [Sesbania bispinosa]